MTAKRNGDENVRIGYCWRVKIISCLSSGIKYSSKCKINGGTSVQPHYHSEIKQAHEDTFR